MYLTVISILIPSILVESIHLFTQNLENPKNTKFGLFRRDFFEEQIMFDQS